MSVSILNHKKNKERNGPIMKSLLLLCDLWAFNSIFTVPSSKYSFTERIKLPIVPLTICDQLLSDSGKTITILQTNAIDTQSKEKKIHNPQQLRRIFESVYGNPLYKSKRSRPSETSYVFSLFPPPCSSF